MIGPRETAPPALWEVRSRSIVDVLLRRASSTPAETAYVFLHRDGSGHTDQLSYGRLLQRAGAIAARVGEAGAPGDRVVLLFPPGLDFICAFFGCLLASRIAVPTYVPSPRRGLDRLAGIVADCGATVALGPREVVAALAPALAPIVSFPALECIVTDDLVDVRADQRAVRAAGSDTIALLQYTSGSTGSPKGVVIDHANLMHNLEVIRQAFGHTQQTRGVSWLPPYHDMGLIGGILQPLYVGFPVVLMSPLTFLQAPVLWLEAISRFGATVSGGPNFAFDLCVRRIGDAEASRLDLRHWEVAFVGAEPVNPDTLERFAQRFEPCGFRRESFLPCYGLAESTLMATGRRKGEGPIVTAFSADELGRGRAEATGQGGKRLVSCGRAAGARAIIVDPETGRRRAQGEVGEIWIAGPSVARGYWNNREETEATFGAGREGGEARFLRTGDLGFEFEGQLYVTGRIKELLIIRGRNFLPQDIERTVEASHPHLRRGGCAVFSVDVQGEERLVVMQEIEPRHFAHEGLTATIRDAVSREHELQVYRVVFLRPGSIPKTTSGKPQRHAARAAFLAGSHEATEGRGAH